MKRLFKELLKVLKVYHKYGKIRRKLERYLPWKMRNHRERLRKKQLRHKKILKFYSQFIKKGDLCFDVGANVGDVTEIFLELGAQVICIEPQQSCLKQLYKKFGNNENVIIVDKAVGDQEGFGKLAICEDAPIISTMSRKWINEGRYSEDYKWTKVQRVSISTLDTLILAYGQPKFCKIDVEGFEELVLKGLTKQIPYIAFEFTIEFFNNAKKCINHLLSIGEVKFNCDLGSSKKFIFPKCVTSDELYKKLNSLKYKRLYGDIYAKFL